MTSTASWAGAPARLTLHTVFEAWRGITRRQVRTTVALGCALFVLLMATGVGLFGGLAALPVVIAAAQLRAFTILLAFVVADRVTGRNPDRRSAYAIAVVVGSLFASLFAVSFVSATLPLFVAQRFDSPTVYFVLYLALDLVLISGATVWVILDRRRATAARERMQRAELERIAAERHSLESDLQALQARVEPQFLFNTLAQVSELYRADTARGERMLDELIAYLRAAMPKMRDTSSTLGQEVELARAYLAIVKVRLGDRLSVSIDLPAGDSGARVPPMMLLPLVDHAVRKDDPATAHSIAIRAAVADGKIRLAVIDSGNAFSTEDAELAGIRDRLEALYDTRASFLLRTLDGEPTEAVLEMPLESEAVDVAAAPELMPQATPHAAAG